MFKEQEMYTQETSRSGVASGTIFLIEDQLVLGMIMKRIITEHTPYQVLHLSEGSHILQMLQEHRPQLLVLDYDLPGMNGIEIYDLVHSTPEWADLPTIMVSASLPEQEIRQRNIPGLRKPCSRGDLLQAIEQALN